MRSWIKGALIGIGVLLLIVAGLIYRSVSLFRGTPAWYRRSTATLAEKEAAAKRAFNKFVGIENAAATIRDGQIADAARAATSPSATPPSAASLTDPSQTITVSFTDDELNAFFEKWSNFEDWKQNYEQYVDDPIIILRKSQILLAGRVKDLDTIVSIEFDPMLDAQGQLNFRLTQILGGRLPLPEPLARPYFNHITDALKQRLPAWRAGAAVDADGAANKDLICASLSRLLIHTLRHEPADPILFLPVVEHHANVPVQIVGMNVQEHSLTVTVKPLDRGQRQALVDRIRAGDEKIDGMGE